MGLLDGLGGLLGGSQGEGAREIIGGLLGQGAPGASSGALGGLLGQLEGGSQAGGPGGLAGVLEQLAANGLGAHVSSWLSNNPNLPISPQQIHDALGGDQVRSMAQSAGLPVDQLLGMLAQHLPQAASEQAGTAAG